MDQYETIQRALEPPPRSLRQRLMRIRCWLRYYHVTGPNHAYPFRYDCPGICCDCGKVGSGVRQDAECTHSPPMSALDEWFRAHDAYHKASATYNERLRLVRSERERGNWLMKLDTEYNALNQTQAMALRADEALYYTELKQRTAPRAE